MSEPHPALSTEAATPAAAAPRHDDSELRRVLPGDSRMAAAMRAHDWTGSPLGPPSAWSRSLRSVVGLLLESQVAMFTAWGPELGFLYNDRYAEILGSKHPKALGSRFQDVWSEIWSDILPLIEAAMSGRSIYREDLPLVMNRQGHDEQTWFTFSYSPVRDDDGQVQGMFCAVWETTAKVMAERALRSSEARLRALNAEALAERKVLADIVASTDAIVQVLDREGRWLAFNRAARETLVRLYGIEPRLGANYFNLLRDLPQQQAEVTAVWKRALRGEEFTLVGEFGDPARARRSFEARFSTLRDANGSAIGAYQFSDDVTERLAEQQRLREAEASLRHAQKLESLGQLTGGVAHDFNNLLQVLSNGVALIEARTGDSENRRTFEGMKRALKRGTDLTRHLLAFSRRQPVTSAPIDLAGHLLGMRDMLSRSLRGDLEVAMDLEPALWPVEADSSELELALLNLCVNARDAMPGGGTVIIRARNASDVPVGDKRGDFVRLAVVDSGTGMSAEVQARAFEPFFTTKETGKGSGLGLAQVYGFAAQSAGEVSIDSDVERGTTVTLLLPRASAPPVPMPEPAAPPASPAPPLQGRLLLVEDDAEVASVTAEMLRALGLDVVHVGTAAAALDALADDRAFDIVLSDVMMPGGMSGVRLAAEIRRGHPGLPVVLTTGYEMSASEARAQGVPVLLKPCGAEAVANVLAAQLGLRG